MKIIVSIQSISDIITNSSSELFATITSESEETLNEIYSLIDKLFGYRQESEITPCVDLYHRPTQEQIDHWEIDSWLRYKTPSEYPEYWIEIEMPYDLEHCKSFYKEGLNAMLKENFGDNFKIIYEKNKN